MISLLAAWVFLLGSVAGLALTLHALAPSRRPRVLVWSFAASMLTIELAAYHLAWQGGAVILFTLIGALDHPAGWAGLAASGGSMSGLFYMALQGTGARATVRAALSGYVRRWEGPTVPWTSLLFPFPVRRPGVRCERDVTYARLSGRRLKLDVYRPAEPGEHRPAILQIHGGAWVVGDKREQGILLCTHLAASGWVAFNANYRLSPGATFPDHLVDLKRALAWIREHAEKYGVDPGFVAVTGGSAGGHLAALMALTANDPRYQPGFETADTSLQAAVPFYGVYDFKNRFGTFPDVFVKRLLQAHVMKAYLDDEPEKFAEASPIDRIHPDAPPFFVVHGDKDTLAPLEDAREFVARLRAVSRSPVFLAELRGAQHAFDLLVTPRSAPVIEAVERFLSEAHARQRAEIGPELEAAPALRAGGNIL